MSDQSFLNRSFGLLTVVLSVLTAAVIGAIVASWLSGRGSGPPSAATSFRGTVVSLYGSAEGGCIRADGGQGVSTADDANCAAPSTSLPAAPSASARPSQPPS